MVPFFNAAVAKQVDARDLKSLGTYPPVPVRFRPAAPSSFIEFHFMIFQVSLTKNIRKLYQPKLNQVKSYIRHSLVKEFNVVNISTVIVSAKVSRELNLKYRGRDYPTNVISLEDRGTREEFNILQGELILCDEIIVNEAKQIANIDAHYAHMIVHGVLHLQGFDHIQDNEATYMEDLEAQILKKLGFDNPYKNA